MTFPQPRRRNLKTEHRQQRWRGRGGRVVRRAEERVSCARFDSSAEQPDRRLPLRPATRQGRPRSPSSRSRVTGGTATTTPATAAVAVTEKATATLTSVSCLPPTSVQSAMNHPGQSKIANAESGEFGGEARKESRNIFGLRYLLAAMKGSGQTTRRRFFITKARSEPGTRCVKPKPLQRAKTEAAASAPATPTMAERERAKKALRPVNPAVAAAAAAARTANPPRHIRHNGGGRRMVDGGRELASSSEARSSEPAQRAQVSGKNSAPQEPRMVVGSD